MSNNATTRKRLFDLFSANLGLFLPAGSEYSGAFACPICLGLFGPQCVNPTENPKADPLLSIAHVYPSSAGGAIKTLTCKKCNSEMGSRYDKHVTIEHNNHAAHQAGLPIDARLSVEGSSSTLNVKMLRHEKGLNMWAIGRNPMAEKVIHAAAMSQDTPRRFTLQWEIPSPARHKVALLHAAHLCLFRDFGYEYLLADTAWVRGILLGAPPETLPNFVFFNVPKALVHIENEIVYRSGVASVDGVRCFIAIFPAADPELAMRCVMLPGPGEEASAAYWQLAKRGAGQAHLDYSLRAFDADPRLTQKVGMDYLNRIWWECDH